MRHARSASAIVSAKSANLIVDLVPHASGLLDLFFQRAAKLVDDLACSHPIFELLVGDGDNVFDCAIHNRVAAEKD